MFPNERFSDTSTSENSDSGDERTPLLRRRAQEEEDHRFIEGLTESHNTRALQQQQQPLNTSTPNPSGTLNTVSTPGTSKPSSDLASDTPKTSGKRRGSAPRVTFSSGTVGGGGGSSNFGGSDGFRTVASSNAFVFPKTLVSSSSSSTRPHKSPGKKNRLVVVTNPPVNIIQEDEDSDDEMLRCNSSVSSEDTLIDFHDVESDRSGARDKQTSQDRSDKSSFSESMESRSSFHSCQESQDVSSDSSQNNELYYSFSSQNSKSS